MARTVDHAASQCSAGTATIHPDLVAHICKVYKVSPVEAPAWHMYDHRRSTWWHRTGMLLMDLLVNPERYVAQAVQLKTIKSGGIRPSNDWIVAWRLGVLQVRSAILADYPGTNSVYAANCILGCIGNGKPDWLLLRQLVFCGWLPKKPKTPTEVAAMSQRRDPAGRLEAADALVDEMENNEHWADR